LEIKFAPPLFLSYFPLSITFNLLYGPCGDDKGKEIDAAIEYYLLFLFDIFGDFGPYNLYALHEKLIKDVFENQSLD
jgi:hypothetical protein